MSTESTSNRFGGRLRSLRRHQGITLQDLARDLGVHFTTVSSWERGRSEPEFAVLDRLASRLGVRVSELLEDPEGRRRKVRLQIWSKSRWNEFMSRTEGLQLAKALLGAGAPESEIQEALERVGRGERPGLADVLALSSAYEVESVETAAPRPPGRESLSIAGRIDRLPAPVGRTAERLLCEWLELFEVGDESSTPGASPASPPRRRTRVRRRGMPLPAKEEP